MAKNQLFTQIDMNETDKRAKEIIKDAELKTSAGKNKGGRKPKEIKADKITRVYMTPEQKESLETYCEKTGISESTLVKQLLAKEGIL
ncbi:MAG: hypothetical protein H6Q69_980 [Firmicutes bacterium]|nr:hypothetical protein [Bacillota bacterium]